MEVNQCVSKLKQGGYEVLSHRQGLNGGVIEVQDGFVSTQFMVPTLPEVVEVKNGQRRLVKPARYNGHMVLFVSDDNKEQ